MLHRFGWTHGSRNHATPNTQAPEPGVAGVAGTCGPVCPPLESGEGSPQAKVIFGEFRKISERSGFFAAFPSI